MLIVSDHSRITQETNGYTQFFALAVKTQVCDLLESGLTAISSIKQAPLLVGHIIEVAIANQEGFCELIFEEEVRWKLVGMFRIEKLRKINKINQSRGLVKEEK